MSSDEQFLDDLVAALRSVKLEAIIVGNTAGILHGAPILTQDVDLLVRDTPGNRRKLRQLAEALGGVGPDEISPLSDVLRILGTMVPVDVVFKLPGGLTFESVRARREKISTGREVATVASLEDLIRSKEAAGRKKDLAVLPILRDTLAVKNALRR